MKITIYTDGSSRGNPGRGGWAAIILEHRQQTTDRDGSAAKMSEASRRRTSREYDADEVIELGGREDMTTNNRMELMGAIMGLKEIDVRQSDNRQYKK